MKRRNVFFPTHELFLKKKKAGFFLGSPFPKPQPSPPPPAASLVQSFHRMLHHACHAKCVTQQKASQLIRNGNPFSGLGQRKEKKKGFTRPTLQALGMTIQWIN